MADDLIERARADLRSAAAATEVYRQAEHKCKIECDTYESAEACDVQWLALEEELTDLRAVGWVDFTQTVCVTMIGDEEE